MSAPTQIAIPAADLNIEDVRIAVVFLDSAFDSLPVQKRLAWRAVFRSAAVSQGLPRNIAMVWQDRSGRKKFMAEPAQRPFFESVRYDQLYAQVNCALTIPDAQTSDLFSPEL